MRVFPQGLTFTACVPHTWLSAPQLQDLFHALWAHGARFHGSPSNLAWETTLTDRCTSVCFPEWPSSPAAASQPSLTALIASLIDMPVGDQAGCDFGFGHSLLGLSILADTTSLEGLAEGAEHDGRTGTDAATVIWLWITVDRPNISPFFGSDRGNRRYTATYHDFLSASRLLCEVAKPFYGFGFHEDDLLDFLGDAQARAAAAALRGEAPAIAAREPVLTYLPEALATPARIAEALAQPEWSVTRLTTGGVFIAPPLSSFSVGEEEAVDQYFAVEPALDRLRVALGDRKPAASPTDSPDSLSLEALAQLEALAHEALQRCERARGLWETAHNDQGVAEVQKKEQDIRRALQRLMASHHVDTVHE